MEPAQLRQKDEKVKSINHALRVLNDAAEDSADEIRTLMTRDYRRLKGVLSEIKPEVKAAFSEMKGATAESVSRIRKRVDHSAHESPWLLAGGAAVLSAVAGFVLGRKSKG